MEKPGNRAAVRHKVQQGRGIAVHGLNGNHKHYEQESEHQIVPAQHPGQASEEGEIGQNEYDYVVGVVIEAQAEAETAYHKEGGNQDQPAEVDYAASPSCKPAVHRVGLDLDQAEGQTEPEADIEQTDCPGGSGGAGIGVDIPQSDGESRESQPPAQQLQHHFPGTHP